MAEQEPDVGIDKQKVVRELAEKETGEPEAPAPVAFPAPAGPPPSILAVLREHIDEVAAVLILLAALIWIVAGLLVEHPLPLAVGGVLIIPGFLALLHRLRPD
ncbi:MAG: hypothetical protein ACYTAF_01150 [Planctomycetota bacterium]|jgi:hypothetical protein